MLESLRSPAFGVGDEHGGGRGGAYYGRNGARLAESRHSLEVFISGYSSLYLDTYRAAAAAAAVAALAPAAEGRPVVTRGLDVVLSLDHSEHQQPNVAPVGVFPDVLPPPPPPPPPTTTMLRTTTFPTAEVAAAAAHHHKLPPSQRPMRIALVYYRPSSLPEAAFEVGFLSALELLEASGRYAFTYVNLDGFTGVDSRFARVHACPSYFEYFDHVWIKSNWNWVVDQFARTILVECKVSISLLVSGSYHPPSIEALFFYDLLFYEVFWYESRALYDHPLVAHAFGIDRRVMTAAGGGAGGGTGAAKAANGTVVGEGEGEGEGEVWDYIFVGAFGDHKGHKRPTLLAKKSGKRLAIGKNSGSEEAVEAVAELEAAGVVVREQVPYGELAALLRRAGTVYVPDDFLGGGERAVLEARSLGVRVEVESDNPKLQELIASPIYDHAYYAAQLDYGMRLLQFQLRLHATNRRHAAEEAERDGRAGAGGGGPGRGQVNARVDWMSSFSDITDDTQP